MVWFRYSEELMNILNPHEMIYGNNVNLFPNDMQLVWAHTCTYAYTNITTQMQTSIYTHTHTQMHTPTLHTDTNTYTHPQTYCTRTHMYACLNNLFMSKAILL